MPFPSPLPAPETIAAIATPPGLGAIGIVRLSGSRAVAIAQDLSGGGDMEPRRAARRHFFRQTADGPQALDEGLLLFFPQPHSYTGEDLVELHGHGNPWLLRQLLQEAVQRGARLANPGEFTQRAFLNGKLDLLQAEAVGDLINAASLAAAQAATRSLSGHFSEAIQSLARDVLDLRVHWEAHLDFADEAIEPRDLVWGQQQLTALLAQARSLLSRARQGAGLRAGLRVTIAGAVNVGKSTLFNQLTQQENAIVNPQPGTTRDVLRAQLRLDRHLLDLSDTAGWRESGDEVEQEGMQRSGQEMARADHILWVRDAACATSATRDAEQERLYPHRHKITVIYNKCDLTGHAAGLKDGDSEGAVFYISAQRGDGVDELLQYLRQTGDKGETADGEVFLARQRHITELERAATHMQAAHELTANARPETVCAQADIVAEELAAGMAALNRITGIEGREQLLNEIFASFCIGK